MKIKKTLFTMLAFAWLVYGGFLVGCVDGAWTWLYFLPILFGSVLTFACFILGINNTK